MFIERLRASGTSAKMEVKSQQLYIQHIVDV